MERLLEFDFVGLLSKNEGKKGLRESIKDPLSIGIWDYTSTIWNFFIVVTKNEQKENALLTFS